MKAGLVRAHARTALVSAFVGLASRPDSCTLAFPLKRNCPSGGMGSGSGTHLDVDAKFFESTKQALGGLFFVSCFEVRGA